MTTVLVHQYVLRVRSKDYNLEYIISTRFNHLLSGNYYKDHIVAAKHIAQYCNEKRNKNAFNINKFNQYALFKYGSDVPDWEGTLEELVKLESPKIQIDT